MHLCIVCIILEDCFRIKRMKAVLQINTVCHVTEGCLLVLRVHIEACQSSVKMSHLQGLA